MGSGELGSGELVSGELVTGEWGAGEWKVLLPDRKPHGLMGNGVKSDDTSQ